MAPKFVAHVIHSSTQARHINRVCVYAPNALLYHVYYRKKRFFRFNRSIRVSLCDVAGETKEEGLSCKLQCPNTHLFYASFTRGSVFEDVAGKGLVHLEMY